MTSVAGLDPSLRLFGGARLLRGPEVTEVSLHRFKYADCRGPMTDEYRYRRLDYLVESVVTLCRGADLVLMEDMLTHGVAGNAVTSLAGLHWIIRRELRKMGLPHVVVNTKVRAKWLTGNGSAGKDECLIAAIKRFGELADMRGNDDADALTLAAMGAAHLGWPLVKMPASSDEQLTKITWPDYPQEQAS